MIQIVKADGRAELALLEAMNARSGQVDKAVTAQVQAIIDDVQQRGDDAVREYTLRFDGSCPDCFEVPKAQLVKAAAETDPDFYRSLELAAKNIRAYHQKQLREGYRIQKENGVVLGQRIRPLARVGLYVPGGTAAYPSSVLMNAIPAKLAGVGELVMVTPPGKDGRPNPDILAAAAVAGVDRLFLIGGAQAVAALALGTQTVPRVDKIVGPGNIYVATAKKLLYGRVDIDMIAGPSEILIVADSSANPAFLAADLMSQAEHDPLASAILLTTDQKIAKATREELIKQSASLSRKEIIARSLADYGAIIVCPDTDAMLELANRIAPEHLELMVQDPFDLLEGVENAGSVFLGSYTPEPMGDYFAGPNHVLPTSGTARFFSPLSVDDFVKKSSYLYYTKEALQADSPHVVRMALREGLTAHANAVKVRTP